ncbi:MAG: plastocyanin/azurin family copper-binding protein [Longimicrobiales bacterium]
MRRFHVRRSKLAAGVVWVTVLLGSCGGDPAGPNAPVATTSVNVQDFSFSPADIVVAPGATVTWTWTGSATHSVDFASASITDGPSQASGTFATAMPMVPGTYAYQCDHHSNMAGTVQVQ